VVVGASVFVALTCAVLVNAGAPLPGDSPVHGWFLRHRAGGWAGAARLVTPLGGAGVAAVVVTVAVGALAVGRLVRPVIVAVLPVAVAAGSYTRSLICAAIARPRPPRADWITVPGGDSFPSGHSSNAVVAYGLLAMIVWVAVGRRGPAGPAGPGGPGGRRSVANWAVAGCGLIALAVGLSRICLGVHWASDVVGGWAYGIVVLGVLAAIAAGTGVQVRPARAAGGPDGGGGCRG
jgi:membrane-associated phospholipid phosphatase